MNKEGAYKAYMKLQERKFEYLELKSKARYDNRKEDAEDYGDRAAVVNECMTILQQEAGLRF